MVPSENHFSKENDTQTCSIESMHHFFMDSNTQTINYTLKGLSHLCTFKNLPQNHLLPFWCAAINIALNYYQE